MPSPCSVTWVFHVSFVFHNPILSLPNLNRTGACSPAFAEQLRCFFYVLMAGLQEMSPVDQVRGMACVLLLLQGPDGNVLPSWFWDYHVKAVSIAKSLPVKIASCHMCCDSPHFKTLVSLMQVSINKEIRVRFRTFYGSYMESMYSLTSFGIVMKTFPLNSLGGLDEDKHEELLRLRRESDSCQDGQDKHVSDGMSTNQQHAPINFPPVVPRDNDVLLGRGKPFQSHKGNVQLTALVHTKYKAAYKKSSVNERVQIVNTIDIHIKQELGGRFLKKTADGLDWVVVSHDEALKKIKNTFRS
uniref:DUF6824 domain-containing protein n=1 Tax=Craspedostauros australis TaxID=1486917 RepID=A0A7R9X0N8_9STRA|mmetsp:Transcript_5515/g.14969  ORF Transcript_5515/g.14969 Transcript_5515/m.14969 type:complete len:300 (+) Transcript_5515:154-1053(+)